MAELSHLERLRLTRGYRAEDKPALKLVEPSNPLSSSEEEENSIDYKPFLCAKQPPRLWLKPMWKEKGYSIQWYPVPVIIATMDVESDGVPQVIEIISAAGRYRIEGFCLEETMALLNQQRVSEVRAYCKKRWPGQKPSKGEPIVTKILYMVEQGVKAGGITPVPQSHLEGEPDHAV